MRIGYLGAGTWGYCLASLLAGKGYQVRLWTRDAQMACQLNQQKKHPRLPQGRFEGDLKVTTDLAAVLKDADLVVESVTSEGIRPVFAEVKRIGLPCCPVIVTSKGIEQNTGLILSDAVVEVLGGSSRSLVGILSGPGYAAEVIQGLPTSVVGSAYDAQVMKALCEAFTSETFRVYPNSDMRGIAFGGALKNIIAIACGISDGLQLGSSSKAALTTRGLHEICKLGVSLGCRVETLYGLAGMGDIFLTCSSQLSRNFRYGYLMAQGRTPQEAMKEIGMVIEGAYTCVSALQLAKKQNIAMPIAEVVQKIIQGELQPSEAVRALMQRTIKEEHL